MLFARAASLVMIGALSSITALAGQQTRDRKPKTNETSTASTGSESFAESIIDAADLAAKLLGAFKDPIFSSKDGFILQALPVNGAALPILFTSVDKYPENLRQEFRNSICQLNPIVNEKSKFAVVCNLDNLRVLEILIRVAHNREFLANNVRNDWAVMQLLKRIQREPAAVLAEAKPAVSENDIKEHLIFLLMFLFAHESWHLQHEKSSSFTETTNRAYENDLLNLIICRNYHEFAREGKTLGGFTTEIIPLPEEGTTKDPAQRKYFATTRAIWQEDIDADRYAAGMLARLVQSFKEGGRPEQSVQHVFSIAIQNFGFLTLTLWYGRLRPFAEEVCSKFAGKDFYLTLCMCEEKKRYTQVLRLFGATHAPIVLRMHSAAKEFGNKLGIDKDVTRLFPVPGPNITIAIFWYNLINALTQVPLKLAMPECVKFTDHIKDSGQLIQIFPDLAGFIKDKGSSTYPGYPADEDLYESQCYSLNKKLKKR